jgi:hypothetical protein
MSFKKNATVFGILLITSIVVTLTALPWADLSLLLGMSEWIVEYPFILVFIVGFVIAGLVSDRMN